MVPSCILEGVTLEAALAKAENRGSTQSAPKVNDAGKRGLSEDSQSTETQPWKFSRTMKGSAELRKPVQKAQQKPKHDTAEGSFGSIHRWTEGVSRRKTRHSSERT